MNKLQMLLFIISGPIGFVVSGYFALKISITPDWLRIALAILIALNGAGILFALTFMFIFLISFREINNH